MPAPHPIPLGQTRPSGFRGTESLQLIRIKDSEALSPINVRKTFAPSAHPT